MGLAAYKSTIRDSETPRQMERRVLTQITYELGKYADAFDATDDRSTRLSILSEGLRDALWRNQKLWSALRHDLASPGNAVPDQLKASLISIALWVDRQSNLVMSGGGRVGSLMEINANISAGLAGQIPATGPQEVQDA